MALTKCHECGNGVSTEAKACPHCGTRPKRSVSKLTIAIVCGIGAFAVWSSVRTDSSTPPPSTTITSPATPAIITGEERKSIVAGITKGLKADRDKMEGITFYTSKGINYVSPWVDAYISLPDDRLPLLRMRARYYGDSWVFFDSVKIMADDVVVYERSFTRSEIARDNSGGSVWETADYHAQAADLVALKAIANAKNATIRFSGRERRDDHTIGSKERRGLQDVITAYEKLTAGLQKHAN